MAEVLNFLSYSDTAIIVLHEIYGVNPHILGVCAEYHAAGYDVYCPNLLDVSEPFSYHQQDEAYTYFVAHVGFGASVRIDELAKTIRGRYRNVFLLGFSVGATLAWICSSSGIYDGAVCYYGSRIRDYLHLVPSCPVLALFARHELSFSPESLLENLLTMLDVSGVVLEAKHGFCKSESPNYDEQATEEAKTLAHDFLLAVKAAK